MKIEIEISFFAFSIVGFVVNTILDNLFNWWFRKDKFGENAGLFIFLYVVKTILILIGLYHVTK